MVDGTKQFWARVGTVTFDFVAPEILNRQNRSLPSLNRTFSNTSMSSVTSTQGSTPEFPPNQQHYAAPPHAPTPAPAPNMRGLPRLTLNNNYSHHSEASSTDSYASSSSPEQSFNNHQA